MVYVLVYSPPKGVELKYVLRRDGPKPRVPVPWRRRNILVRARVPNTPPPPPPPPPPRTRVGGAAPPGGRRRPSRRLYSVHTPRGWLGPARGEFLWPQIRRWDRRRCCWRISGPPRGPEIRWVLSVGWCHQSTWSLYIMLGHTPCIRRPAGAYKGDFWKSELLAKDALTEQPSSRAAHPRAAPQLKSSPAAAQLKSSPPQSSSPAQEQPTPEQQPSSRAALAVQTQPWCS
jgi:hypothetical protein